MATTEMQKRLPTIKTLRTEYATALEEKRKACAAYREAKKDMRELLVGRENVERLLDISQLGTPARP